MKRVQELHRQGLLFNNFHSTLAVDLVVSSIFAQVKWPATSPKLLLVWTAAQSFCTQLCTCVCTEWKLSNISEIN